MSSSAGPEIDSTDGTIVSLLRIHPRFMRSVQLERDLKDPTSSGGYVLTPVANQALERIVAGFAPTSTLRAWRVAGDYGSGKTDLALILSRIAEGRREELPQSLHRFIPAKTLMPVAVSGDMEPLAVTLLRALGRPADLNRRNGDVVVTISNAVNRARHRGHAGILMVIDELGKNLEYAARYPDSNDVFLLQRLAEYAAGSRDKPFVLVALLHQGLAAYASALDTAAKREWSKVAGRFEEIAFAYPLEHTTALMAAALNVRTDKLPDKARIETKVAMKKAIGAGLYTAAGSASCIDLAPSLFPLHPTVLPLLVRTMRRLSQNERSLFSFISSFEPKGLQDHCAGQIEKAGFYRLHHLYEYVAYNLYPPISTSSFRTHWGVIEAVLGSTVTESVAEDRVLKTVGIFNLLDSPDFAATEETITLAASGWCSSEKADVVRAVRSLKTRGILYERGSVRGLCLWPHTSVDLDRAFANAVQATRNRETGAPDVRTLCQHIKLDHLVPRAHYIRTGTLRYAGVSLLPFADLDRLLANQPSLDGGGPDLFVRIVLPTEKEQHRQARAVLRDTTASLSEGLIVAVAEPQSAAVGALSDLIAWQWVQRNTPELSGDRYAREEVARQILAAERNLHDCLGGLTALASGGGQRLFVFSREGEQQLASGRPLLKFLGEQCDTIYKKAPTILNELINRRYPSSAAVAARTKLVEAMGAAPEKANLGMDDRKRPAEMALYLSILKTGGFHVRCEDRSGWAFRLPDRNQDACNLLPAIHNITETLKASGLDALVPVPTIFDALSRPPFGIREGLLPFVLAIYLSTLHHRVALYEDGSYLHQIRGDDFLRLMKEQHAFHVQYCAVEGVRADVFTKLLELLRISPRDSRQQDLIDLVRPLAIFISREVPDYARRTNYISATAAAVRRALLEAREPVRLIFTVLPQACGLRPILEDDSRDSTDPREFAARLSHSLHEIRTAYSKLVDRLGSAIRAAFDGAEDAKGARGMILGRASQLAIAVTEPTLKAFAVRLADPHLSDNAWVESVANLLTRKSPERWSDADELEFNYQLELAAGRFRRVEAALFQGANVKLNGRACRIALTKTDGTEVQDIVRWEDVPDERLRSIQTEISSIICKHGREGLAATMKALWENLNETTSGRPSR